MFEFSRLFSGGEAADSRYGVFGSRLNYDEPRLVSRDATAHVTFPRYAAVTLAKIDGNLRRLGRKRRQ